MRKMLTRWCAQNRQPFHRRQAAHVCRAKDCSRSATFGLVPPRRQLCSLAPLQPPSPLKPPCHLLFVVLASSILHHLSQFRISPLQEKGAGALSYANYLLACVRAECCMRCRRSCLSMGIACAGQAGRKTLLLRRAPRARAHRCGESKVRGRRVPSARKLWSWKRVATIA